MTTGRRSSVAVLGFLTIAAYGAWFYSFGVLLDPIIADTGWSEPALATAFAAGLFTSGFGATFAGRLLDGMGSRVPFSVGAVVGGLGFTVASAASSLSLFIVGSVVGGSVFGAFGFYHVTQTVAARLDPDSPARSIAQLTVWGAFSSTLYLPVAAFLVERFGWRVALRLLAASAVVMFVVAATAVSVAPTTGRQHESRRRVLARILSPGRRRRFTIAVGLVGIASSVTLAYQVPVMTAAGLSLSTAASIAGLRGAFQVTGRLPLRRLIDRLGSRGAMQLSLGAITVGALLLIVASNVPIAFAFAVVTGFGIGAFSPLQGIRSNELFDPRTLGATMGTLALVFMVAGAIGPTVAGLLAGATGDRRWAPAIAAVCAGVAVLVVRDRGDDQEPRI